MEGASRQSLAAVRRRLDDMLREPVAAGNTDAGLIQRGLARLRAATGTGPDPAQLAAELFAVADLLQAEAGLRRALADPGTAQRARIGLLEQVLSGKVSDDALEVLRWAVESRWSRDRDLESAIDSSASKPSSLPRRRRVSSRTSRTSCSASAVSPRAMPSCRWRCPTCRFRRRGSAVCSSGCSKAAPTR